MLYMSANTGVRADLVVERKYIKPKSVTWWASFVPLLAGLTLATQDIHAWSDLVAVIDRASGGMTPFQLINVGLLGIGIRGALR